MNRSTGATDYSLVIEWSEGDHAYIATCPELPGCRTHGATRAEALRRGEEGIAEWLELAADLRWEIPAPRLFDGQPHAPDGTIVAAPVTTIRR